MLKWIVGIFFSSFLFMFGLCAASPHYLTKNQIMITDNGFVINVDGQLYPAETITYQGSGIYSVSQAYYGSCRRCGWALDKDGRCPNQNCNGYGPNRD